MRFTALGSRITFMQKIEVIKGNFITWQSLLLSFYKNKSLKVFKQKGVTLNFVKSGLITISNITQYFRSSDSRKNILCSLS